MNTKTYSIRNIKNSAPSTPSRLRIILIVLAGIALLGIALIIIARHSSIFGDNTSDRPTANQATKGEPAATSSSSSTPSSAGTLDDGTATSDSNSKDQVSNSNTPALTLLSPAGNFVSNYQPTLASPKNLMQSVCRTTPGATCQISFTKDGITKRLDGRLTDKGGSVYWTWKLQDIDITTGSWKIQATSEMNGKTASTTDTIPMEVQP